MRVREHAHSAMKFLLEKDILFLRRWAKKDFTFVKQRRLHMKVSNWTITKSKWLPNALVFSVACLRHKGVGFTFTIGLGVVSYHFAYRNRK